MEESYTETQVSQPEQELLSQKGDTVFFHNCPPQARQCNNVTANTGKPRCKKCNKDGHTDEQCWIDRTCGKCGKKGHVPKYCKEAKMGPDPKGYRSTCTRCGSSAHKTDECPMYKHERLMFPCPVCENYFGKSYWHNEEQCMVRKMLLRPVN